MKELVDQGFVESRAGVADRRRRLLFPTPKGRRLALDLASVQSRRFERVLAGLAPGAKEDATRFLLALIDAPDREAIRASIEGRVA